MWRCAIQLHFFLLIFFWPHIPRRCLYGVLAAPSDTISGLSCLWGSTWSIMCSHILSPSLDPKEHRLHSNTSWPLLRDAKSKVSISSYVHQYASSIPIADLNLSSHCEPSFSENFWICLVFMCFFMVISLSDMKSHFSHFKFACGILVQLFFLILSFNSCLLILLCCYFVFQSLLYPLSFSGSDWRILSRKEKIEDSYRKKAV